MQPDPQRTADTESWLRKASNDLRYAGIDLAANPPAPEDAVFHCQQAVEKALKAFLVWHDVPFVKTHDLGKLGNQAVQLDPSSSGQGTWWMKSRSGPHSEAGDASDSPARL
jgi:HEPN domain-containing protein